MNTPAWHREPVKSFRDIDYFYRTKPGQASRKRVLLAQITGTLYTEYAEHRLAPGVVEKYVVEKYTWQQMQRNLIKAKWGYPQLRELYLSYYDPDKEHMQLALQQHGPDYLIDGGNNRLCTWKFAERESILVQVQEYDFDEELRVAGEELLAQRITVVRLDEHDINPRGFWELQLGDLTVTCMGREDVLSFARAYAGLSVQGLARLWLRWAHRRHLILREGDSLFAWKAGITEHIPWFERIYPRYLLAYKMQQKLLHG